MQAHTKAKTLSDVGDIDNRIDILDQLTTAVGEKLLTWSEPLDDIERKIQDFFGNRIAVASTTVSSSQ